ncbi:MAG: hypothetical protein ACNI26_08465 [Terasakiella sp.]|uniref:hypothetical protein n=1 Tax=unclassified Terasakiella TaxID=2614952 RepID=UPI003AFF6F76
MNRFFRKVCTFFLIFSFVLLGSFFVYADDYEVIGKIVELKGNEYSDKGQRYVAYRLRVKQKELEDRKIPLLFTATIHAEKGGEHDRYINQLSNNGHLAFLKVNKINVRYEISDIQPVKLIKSNGLFTSGKNFKNVGNPTKEIIYDPKNRVVISNQKKVSKSVNIGSSGISLGN